ncbi:MAG: hypothetical protein Q8M79_04405 [Dehalococcoidia bacterium]|nr:hypothetical protein [Dehalococcoidia bacterium]
MLDATSPMLFRSFVPIGRDKWRSSRADDAIEAMYAVLAYMAVNTIFMPSSPADRDMKAEVARDIEDVLDEFVALGADEWVEDFLYLHAARLAGIVAGGTFLPDGVMPGLIIGALHGQYSDLEAAVEHADRNGWIAESQLLDLLQFPDQARPLDFESSLNFYGTFTELLIVVTNEFRHLSPSECQAALDRVLGVLPDDLRG